jgi:Flp pilus assembly protein TadB/Mg-chelatase subunit ChlD
MSRAFGGRGTAAAAAGLAATLLLAGPAAAAPAVTPDLAVSSAQTSEGQLRFYLSAHNLPAGTSLTTSSLSVRAGTDELKSTVEVVDARSTPVGDSSPRGAVLVLDASGSMAGAPLDAARDAASAYAAALPPDAALGLVTVGDRATELLPPTTDRSRFNVAINGVTAAGGTAVYDGLSAASKLLATHTEYTERRIAVLADGGDTSSADKPTDVSAAFATERIRMDAVAFGANAADADLKTLATDTGGQVLAATDKAGLHTALTDLAASVAPTVLVTAEVPTWLGGRTVSLTVSVPAASGPLATTPVDVALHADSRAQKPLTAAAVSVGIPSIVYYLALAAIMLSLVVLLFAVTYRLLDRSKVRDRLRQLDRFTGGGPDAVAHADGSALYRAALAVSDQAIRRRGEQNRIEDRLDQAAIDLRPSEWILLRVIATVTAGVIGAVLLPWLFGLVVGAIAGFLLPDVYRRQRANRRANRFADLLPEALQLVVSALRTGFSLSQAIDALVKEGPEPVAGEFSRALAEIRLGGGLEDALDRVAVRNNSRDLAWLVMAIRIQREVGGNLSEVMETAVATMRERGQLQRHVRALSAEGRLSAYVLTALPVGVAAFMFAARGDYIRPLYTTFLGLVMLVTAVVLLGVGAFWFSRLVKVKV